MIIKQIRDITVITISDDMIMGVSVDSCGGIGEKENDTIHAPNFIVGSQTAKVMLAELMCMGFTPKLISDGIANEMDNTASEIITGIKETISKLDTDIHITGSTEENAITTQTAMGTTCIGFAHPDNLKIECSKNGDVILIVGIPSVGPEVVEHPERILQIEDFEFLCSLCTQNSIHQIIPIGSKGASYEIDLLCKENGLKFENNKNFTDNFKKSGGPSTAAIISIDENELSEFKNIFNKPAIVVGKISL